MSTHLCVNVMIWHFLALKSQFVLKINYQHLSKMNSNLFAKIVLRLDFNCDSNLRVKATMTSPRILYISFLSLCDVFVTEFSFHFSPHLFEDQNTQKIGQSKLRNWHFYNFFKFPPIL